MVITVVRATVAAERMGDLERAYREGTAELASEFGRPSSCAMPLSGTSFSS